MQRIARVERGVQHEIVTDAAAGLSVHLDEAYACDNLNRLTTFHRGNLDGNHAIPATTNRSYGQAWGLSAVGAWNDYQVDSNGDGDFSDAADLDQDRSHNLANEIYSATPGAAITEGGGQSSWADPAYDARGNMTTVPKPSDLTSTYTCTYDAWNRLVEVRSGEIVVAKYEYDALNRRTKECVDTDTDGDFDEFRHFYYTDGWQLLETRLGRYFGYYNHLRRHRSLDRRTPARRGGGGAWGGRKTSCAAGEAR